MILAGTGAKVTLAGADLQGATLETAGTGKVLVGTGTNAIDGTAAAITNNAAVTINNGATLTAQGSIIDNGSISLAATTSATELLVGAAGVTLSGAGKVSLGGNANDKIVGASGAAASLANFGSVMGGGALGGGQLSLNNYGLVEQTGLGALVVDTGVNSVLNPGVIAAAGKGGATVQSAVYNSGVLEALGGNLTVNGAVGGAGDAVVNGATLTFNSSFDQAVHFQGKGTLALAQSQSFNNEVYGFSNVGTTTALDLKDISFIAGTTTATFNDTGGTSSGVLTVTDGTHTANIKLVGDYAVSKFVVSSDGSGGTKVVDPAAGGGHPWLAQAAAGLGSPAARQTSGALEAWRAPPTLAAPHALS